MPAVTRIFTPFVEPAFNLMRLFFGLLFSFHGAQKLFAMFGHSGAEGPLMTVAGVVEFFGGLAIAVGLLTPIFALLAAGQMTVAYLMVHLPRGPWPIQNQGELALLYLFGFLFIMTRGSGRWSLDQVLFGSSPAARAAARPGSAPVSAAEPEERTPPTG